LLPRAALAQTLGGQFLRSGTSVGAHYREACRARSVAEFVSKMSGGLQELDEAAYWLELAQEAPVLPQREIDPVYRESQELTAIFVSSINTAKKRR
jgi:four helix bundle protein